MNRWKSSLTCSYCSKIFKDLIGLPCKHHLCNEHLTEKKVAKQNRIKCAEWKQDFEIKDNDFKVIEIIKKQIDDHAYLSDEGENDFKSNNCVKNLLDELVYLNDEEFSLKKQIQDSIQTFFQMYEEFTLNKTRIDLDVHEQFQDIKFTLDEHREVLKQKIDDIYMEMIDKTKKFEATYLKSLEDQLNASLKSFETISLVQSLKEIEETIWNPNISIESIRDMQHLQEEAISELKSKLGEQSQVNDEFDEWLMNEFKPNVSFN